MCQPPNLRKTCYAEISVASHGIYRVFHSLLSSFLHFFFSFQIYHSPIHKQAESKSVIIPPHILSYHVMTCGQIHTVMSHVTHQVTECIRVHVFTKCYIKMFLVKPGVFCFFFTSTVELNEIGFKFVRKCINYIETNGKGSNYKFMPAIFSFLSFPEGGVVES